MVKIVFGIFRIFLYFLLGFFLFGRNYLKKKFPGPHWAKGPAGTSAPPPPSAWPRRTPAGVQAGTAMASTPSPSSRRFFRLTPVFLFSFQFIFLGRFFRRGIYLADVHPFVHFNERFSSDRFIQRTFVG